MSGPPPPTPPKLSYKSRAEREREERERREREEREREERERREREERRAWERTERDQRGLERAARERVGMERRLRREEAQEASGGAALPQALRSRPTMFEEDAREPGLRREDIQMLGAPEEVEGEPGIEGEEPETKEAEEAPQPPRRRPSRPPKSPDMRPVYIGFLLVAVGLIQLLWGVVTMARTPEVGTGVWSQLLKWSHFSMGLTAAVLGLLALRGGLWSFRKERFSVVKVGALSATICVWALWVPWLFGLAALLTVQRARDEYYPFYDPRRDAPSWAHPPPRPGEEREGEGEAEAEAPEGAAGPPAAVEAAPREHAVEAMGVQEAHVMEGTGWEEVS